MTSDWLAAIDGVLLDISGVLIECGIGAISGSVDAVKRLRESDLPVRFCTNEATTVKSKIVEKLQKFGFPITDDEVFSPIPAACKFLKENSLRPHLLIHPDAMTDFAEVDKNNPNCVVVGDAEHLFTYENLNKAFQLLISLENPVLISLGKGKYYQYNGKLCLDVGAFTKALEYACDISAEIIGKPSSTYYNIVLTDMGINANNVVMVGDDIVSDVGGSQACGMKGVQVKTGKFRPADENHPTVKPDLIVDNLAQFVDILLVARKASTS